VFPTKAFLSKQTQSVGRWFPAATKLKRGGENATAIGKDDPRKCSILLFYQYVEPAMDHDRLDHWRSCLLALAEQRGNFSGRIRLAPEGVNCTLSAIDDDTVSAAATLRHVVYDLQRLDPIFNDTDLKFFDKLTADRHFAQFTLIPVKELVYYGGWTEAEASIRALGGKHVSPEQFHDLLQDPESVVVDVRNHYEAAIGRFDGQTVGAQYIDPKLRKSTDFTDFVQKSKDLLAAKKRVLLYCTGGIRCERASAHLKAQLMDDSIEVCQLQGGIERYLQTFPDGGFWRGKNFTFDKREAVAPGNPNGDGGVVGKKIRPTKLAGCECCVCGEPWDRYIGKKKCTTCGVPVLMCTACLEGDKHRDPLKVRCPLCVEQNVTVPVKDVEYTENGVAAVPCASTNSGKAAPSVLKWGGGHATEKKQRRRLKAKPCKFGSACQRPDCFFSHPTKQE
jgi:predicted sulfurtransferase